MAQAKDDPKQVTKKGYPIPARPREDVLREFRKIARPIPEKAPKKA